MRKQSDCNNCKQYKCPAIKMATTTFCGKWAKPSGTFPLWELLLAHPQSTHDTLRALPFKVTFDLMREDSF